MRVLVQKAGVDVGFAKAFLMDRQERGFDLLDGYVCRDCVNDEAIKEFIEDNAGTDGCDFCNQKLANVPTADARAVTELFWEGINDEYDLAQNELGTMDGEYFGEQLWMEDLLRELDCPLGEGKFQEGILRSAADTTWASRDYYSGGPHEVLLDDWGIFCDLIVHHSRFAIFELPDPGFRTLHSSGNELRVGDLLDRILEIAEKLGLLREFKAGEIWHRGRLFEFRQAMRGQSLGPPQPEQATSGRMSPAGIPALYLSDSEATVHAELDQAAVCNDRYIRVGGFALAADVRILDLTNLPELPSLFDDKKRELRGPLQFLRGFSESVSSPVRSSNREKPEYAPTQAFSEFIRAQHLIRKGSSHSIGGIAYASSVKQGGRNLVLYPSSDQGAQPPGDSEVWPVNPTGTVLTFVRGLATSRDRVQAWSERR